MNSLVGKFVSTWTRPWAAMQGVKEQSAETSIAPSMLFVIVMGLISGLITAIMGTIFPAPGAGRGIVWLAVAVVPLASFIGSFIAAFIIWALVDGVLRGSAIQYKSSYRIIALLAAFSPVSALLSPIPKVGPYLAILVNIWATVVMIQGIIIVMDTPKVRTWVACVLIFGFLLLLTILARVAAQRQLPGNGSIGGFGASDEFGAPTGLDKELEDLANKSKSDNTAAPSTNEAPAPDTTKK